MDNLAFVKNFYKQNKGANLNELVEVIASWEFIFINDLNKVCSPSQMYNETLFIDCVPGAIIEVINFKTHIINNVNTFFGKKIISNIVFVPRL